tara:strand:+ start:4231 stop:5310 length:1080 start_codon:yes stop_codon:yes gene_type:complete
VKLAIVGAGNAGCITALHYQRYLSKDYKGNFEISIYHSPSTHPIEKVGQGTISPVVELVGKVLGIDWYNNPIDATFKNGILYEGWGKKNEKFHHSFRMDEMSMHFVPQKLSNTVLNSGYFNVVEKVITDPEKEIDANFIFDCRGRSNRDRSNYETLVNPLNSVLLYKKEGKDINLNYTKTVATPNGWTFVIPNIDSVSYGYLYNNEITSKEDAKEDFLNRFDLPEIDDDLTFENYMAKNVFVGERTILNGNMFGFIEPLEASSLGVYQHICRQTWDCIFGDQSPQESNNNIRQYMRETEIFILWLYQYGSKYDTKFWKYAKSLPYEPNDKLIRMLNNTDSTEQYGQWESWNMDVFKRNC